MTTPFTIPVRMIASLCPSIPLAFEVYSRFRETKAGDLPRNRRACGGSGGRKDGRGNRRGGSARASHHSLHAVALRL